MIINFVRREKLSDVRIYMYSWAEVKGLVVDQGLSGTTLEIRDKIIWRKCMWMYH